MTSAPEKGSLETTQTSISMYNSISLATFDSYSAFST